MSRPSKTGTVSQAHDARNGTLVEISGLRFSYDALQGGRNGEALSDPTVAIETLQVRPGEVAVLIGDNGCGKTTLLKLIAGLLTSQEGDIRIRDAENAVLVHQKPYLFAESVFANVVYPLKLRKTPRAEARSRATAALETVGLAHLARRWAPSLSGGEKQRVAIARALVLRPRVLLLDEPTSNIDYGSIRTIEKVLRELADLDVAVIMSTHNLASAYRLADRIVPMAAGRRIPLEVNVLRGVATEAHDEHIGVFQTVQGVDIYCPAGNEGAGTAVIRMDDIILSGEEITTSAQNRLQGSVTAVERLEHDLFNVKLDCDGVILRATVTQTSVEELEIRPGTALHVTFKASAVKLY